MADTYRSAATPGRDLRRPPVIVSRPTGDRDDTALVDALRHGDERAFAVLVARYHPSLVRLARTYVDDGAVAEEVAQEAWLGLLSGLGRYAGRASLQTWLFHILVNCARARRRREAHSIAFSDLGEPVEEYGPTVDPARFHPDDHRWAGHWSTPPSEWPESLTLSLEIGECLARAVDRLPPRQRSILTLRDIEGWPAGEVCALLGISPENARVLLHRARAHVRRELEVYLAQADEGAAS
jgi:RNA polymerase sigma-70 factor (ECF subfamily)